ncbi:MAG: hypothetical protein CMJ81_15450 [Planctomycetaceae bacterium]|nr:hypothetical protein [Planctomycetaceae bacterium]
MQIGETAAGPMVFLDLRAIRFSRRNKADVDSNFRASRQTTAENTSLWSLDFVFHQSPASRTAVQSIFYVKRGVDGKTVNKMAEKPWTSWQLNRCQVSVGRLEVWLNEYVQSDCEFF